MACIDQMEATTGVVGGTASTPLVPAQMTPVLPQITTVHQTPSPGLMCGVNSFIQDSPLVAAAGLGLLYYLFFGRSKR